MTPDDDSDDNNNNAVANTTVNAFEHITIRRCLQGYCHPILTHYIRKTVPISQLTYIQPSGTKEREESCCASINRRWRRPSANATEQCTPEKSASV
ncbi:hypothetical protein C8034_v008502 [Colletotrichum sidae]|uniref:Uncharacterized protein n=1 Tax=Colletotrichum sidae TaxID=1347389 RepID=A0A4R8TSV7_9PEZI|nr:hypothetical protein C8034_v008502 [Colletotrichum sidae]